MNKHIKTIIEKGNVILFLGAGASATSKTKNDDYVPTGGALAKILANIMSIDYHDEPISIVYSAAKNLLGEELNDILESNFKHTKPSKEYLSLAEYPFARIYTLNIDDALEKAFHLKSTQNLNVRGRNDKRKERDQSYRDLDYIKLNGDISKPMEGYVFSPEEYGRSAAEMPIWYDEVANDFYNFTFIFIGTQLNEPLLEHHIQRYKGRNKSIERISYLITPSITPLYKIELQGKNIEHIPGTLGDFTEWLKHEFPNGLNKESILLKSRPEFNVSGITDEERYIAIFNDITVVTTSTLRLLNEQRENQPINDFYKGYKALWRDIIDEIPAQLTNTNKAYNICVELLEDNATERAFVIFGNAGSGKSTLLKQVALQINNSTNTPTYYVDSLNTNIKEVAHQLSLSIKQKFFIFVEKVADHAEEIGSVLKDVTLENCIIVGTENRSFWSYRGLEHLENAPYRSIDISHIDESDARNILEKIKLYGNWTKLRKMSPRDRVKTLLDKSKKQLLIGLLETTLGEGYKRIIKKEFESIPSDAHRALLILVGISSYQRTRAHESTLTRALRHLGYDADIFKLAREMNGILNYRNGELETRHFTYINTLFDNFVEPEFIKEILCSYLESFIVYEHPIIHNTSKSEAAIYKSLTNAKFLSNLLKDRKDLVLDIFRSFEKKLEHEALFLLQYGLALRSFHLQTPAFEKIQLALEAYPESAQIEHALSQQMLIIANEDETDKITAESLLNKAKIILGRLDMTQQKDLFDAYPIVTLSEGHVKVANRIHGVDVAKSVAADYHKLISERIKYTGNQNKRLTQTKDALLKFSINGVFPRGTFLLQ